MTMIKLHALVTYMVAHWKYIGSAWLFITAAATFINARLPKTADGSPMVPSSWPQFIWMLIVDMAAVTPQPGKAGIFGMLPVNLPGLPSHSPPVPVGLPLPTSPEQKSDR